jgi:acyl CoA:acetate/3-ketoacid CoA transferase alpha subunit
MRGTSPDVIIRCFDKTEHRGKSLILQFGGALGSALRQSQQRLDVASRYCGERGLAQLGRCDQVDRIIVSHVEGIIRAHRDMINAECLDQKLELRRGEHDRIAAPG